jgi:hypothetical protein
MARRKHPVRRHEISMEHHGKTYRAHYYVENGVVTVEAMSQDATVARLSTQIGGSTAKHVAHMLLNEIIDAGRARAFEQ